jgi:hypothetical protein
LQIGEVCGKVAMLPGTRPASPSLLSVATPGNERLHRETTMRQMLVPIVLSAGLLSTALAQTSPAPPIKACSLLTRDLV